MKVTGEIFSFQNQKGGKEVRQQKYPNFQVRCSRMEISVLKLRREITVIVSITIKRQLKIVIKIQSFFDDKRRKWGGSAYKKEQVEKGKLYERIGRKVLCLNRFL